jgi:GNAT superfamily N-acetyltransferase
MVAEARYAVAADGRSAQFALAVADQWQRRGLATQLMATLERVAAAAGVARLTGECLAINEGFVSFARSLGYRVHADGVIAACCKLRRISMGQTGPGRQLQELPWVRRRDNRVGDELVAASIG